MSEMEGVRYIDGEMWAKVEGWVVEAGHALSTGRRLRLTLAWLPSDGLGSPSRPELDETGGAMGDMFQVLAERVWDSKTYEERERLAEEVL